MSKVGIVSLSSASAGSSESSTASLKCLPLLAPSLLPLNPLISFIAILPHRCRYRITNYQVSSLFSQEESGLALL